jgi:hypothetical protein
MGDTIMTRVFPSVSENREGKAVVQTHPLGSGLTLLPPIVKPAGFVTHSGRLNDRFDDVEYYRT